MKGSEYLYRICQILKYNISNKKFIMKAEPIQAVMQIKQKRKINHDTYIYDLVWAQNKFKLEIGQHFRIVEKIPTYFAPEGEEVVRKYTPISLCNQEDRIEMLIKIYRPNFSMKFPHGGKLTPYIEKLQIGGKINVQGPFGRFGYKSGGIVVIDGQEMKKKRIFFVAGGSGLTPCYQTIQEIINMPEEDIELILLFANKTEEDIVLREELQSLKPRIKLHYILDTPSEKWTGLVGFATEQVMKQICPLNDPDTLYIYCGPAPMNAMIRGMFAQKYPQSTAFKY